MLAIKWAITVPALVLLAVATLFVLNSSDQAPNANTSSAAAAPSSLVPLAYSLPVVLQPGPEHTDTVRMLL